MKAENTIWIYYDLWDYDPPNPSWKEVHAKLEPLFEKNINRAFIPQTVMDSIWLFYEFKDSQDKEDVLKSLSEVVANKVIREPDQKLLDKWTQ